MCSNLVVNDYIYVNTIPKIQEFINKCSNISTLNVNIDKMSKIAVLINLIELTVILSNFVLMDYGTVALFGCPTRDEKDYAEEFLHNT
ncbi:hypothetical protein [Orientia tsutsugamushi]|uniref:Leucine--tRNA ligase n=1 Tax=Orientia tsutsugamushi TaxID=784 RepID=A0A2U3RQZ6_ORITS|nr:hypothetical protein [Orientia tsutsugamushi]KJV57396.1 leucyl-tRNA synthetase, Domain 2 family protein [Orientia tsutsugamushi str. Karp]SPR15644.1 leucine--tRNA ligase [Orientia tsutsugamushi]